MSGYDFPQAKAILSRASAPRAAAGGAPAAAAKVEEKVEEEVDAGTGNLFGDEDEY